jgi:hypothetical protein
MRSPVTPFASRALVLALVAFTACTQKDVVAPGKPNLDPIASPTAKQTIEVTGSAEFGSTVKITGGAADVTVTADPYTARFRADVALNTTLGAGSISVKNTLSVTATDTAGNTSEATTVDVLFGPEPGVPANLAFMLTGAAASGTVAAGTDVTYSYRVTDAYDGGVLNPLEVIASAPNTTIFDDGISGNGLIMGFTRAGDYTITARAAGTAGVKQVVPIKVTPAAGQRYVTTTLTLSRIATGDTTAALTLVKDLYDNVIVNDTNGTSMGLTLTCTPQAANAPAGACAKAGNAFTITSAGVYQITASFNDGTNPVASASQYVLVEDAPDVVAPTASIASIVYPTGTSSLPRTTNARVEVQVTLQDNKSLSTAQLYAIFGGNPACTSTSSVLLLNGATSTTTNVSLREPACAFAGDVVSLFVVVIDASGNQGFSATNSTLSVSSVSLGGLAGTGGYGVKVLGQGQIGGGGGPATSDFAWDPSTQIAYVTSSNSTRIGVLLPDRTRANLLDNTGQTYGNNQNWQTLGGIAVTGVGDFFLGRTNGGGAPNSGGVDFIPASLPTNPVTEAATSNASTPTRLVYVPAAKALCAARITNATSTSCYSFDTTTNALTQLFAGVTTTGNTAGIAVGTTATAGTYALWLVSATCGVSSTTTTLAVGSTPAAPTALTVTPALPGTCVDIAALPSGDVAVLTSTSVVRVTAAGAATTIVSGLTGAYALDYAAGTGGGLFVLSTDASNNANQLLLQVTPPNGTNF